jgi:hypothetical protein
MCDILKPWKSISQTICSCSGERFRIAFSMQYTKYLICPFVDFEFCIPNKDGKTRKMNNITLQDQMINKSLNSYAEINY